jgi:hypothetical protein
MADCIVSDTVMGFTFVRYDSLLFTAVLVVTDSTEKVLTTRFDLNQYIRKKILTIKGITFVVIRVVYNSDKEVSVRSENKLREPIVIIKINKQITIATILFHNMALGDFLNKLIIATMYMVDITKHGIENGSDLISRNMVPGNKNTPTIKISIVYTNSSPPIPFKSVLFSINLLLE